MKTVQLFVGLAVLGLGSALGGAPSGLSADANATPVGWHLQPLTAVAAVGPGCGDSD